MTSSGDVIRAQRDTQDIELIAFLDQLGATARIVALLEEPRASDEIIAEIGFPTCAEWAGSAGYDADGLGVLRFFHDALSALCRDGRISPYKSYRWGPHIPAQDEHEAFTERMMRRALSKGGPGDPFTPGRRLAALDAAISPRCECRKGGAQCTRTRKGEHRWCDGCYLTRQLGRRCSHLPEAGE